MRRLSSNRSLFAIALGLLPLVPGLSVAATLSDSSCCRPGVPDYPGLQEAAAARAVRFGLRISNGPFPVGNEPGRSRKVRPTGVDPFGACRAVAVAPESSQPPARAGVALGRLLASVANGGRAAFGHTDRACLNDRTLRRRTCRRIRGAVHASNGPEVVLTGALVGAAVGVAGFALNRFLARPGPAEAIRVHPVAFGGRVAGVRITILT